MAIASPRVPFNVSKRRHCPPFPPQPPPAPSQKNSPSSRVSGLPGHLKLWGEWRSWRGGMEHGSSAPKRTEGRNRTRSVSKSSLASVPNTFRWQGPSQQLLVCPTHGRPYPADLVTCLQRKSVGLSENRSRECRLQGGRIGFHEIRDPLGKTVPIYRGFVGLRFVITDVKASS